MTGIGIVGGGVSALHLGLRLRQDDIPVTKEIVQSASDWTNFMLASPAPRLIAMLVAMSLDKSVADEFTDNFDYPDRQWSILATPERTRRYLRRRGFDMDELLASLDPLPA